MGSGVLKAKVGGQWVPIIGSGMSAESARWNSAWGIIAYAQKTADQGGFGGTILDISGLIATFTPVVGRRYVTTASWMFQTNSSSPTTVVALLRDGANAILQQRNMVFAAGAWASHAYIQVVETGLAAVSATRRASWQTTVGTVDVFANATYPAFIEVRDVGPVTPSAVAPPNPTPAWITPTLLNGWVNVSSSTFTSARYRLNGDRVEVEGLVGGGAYSVAIFTLPAGYRPSKNFVFTCFGSGANGAIGAFRVDVQPDGTVLVQAAAAGTTGPPSYMTLTGIQFSITP